MENKHTMKDDLYRYFCGNINDEGDIGSYDTKNFATEDYAPLWEAFKSVNFEADAFLNDGLYKTIEKKELLNETLMDVCLMLSPVMAEYMIDWQNGYLDFDYRDAKTSEKDSERTELLKQLYFCQTDEDLWNLMARGVGNVKYLYKWYQGINPSPIMDKLAGTQCYCTEDKERADRFVTYMRRKHFERSLEDEITFTLKGDELRRYLEFKEKHVHPKSCPQVGDVFTIGFTPTGIGTIADVTCNICGEKECLTDLDAL